MSVPANALTLEEVHARENIHPSPSQEYLVGGSSGQGMAAFNKLIAAMQSKQQLQQDGNEQVGLREACVPWGRCDYSVWEGVVCADVACADVACCR